MQQSIADTVRTVMVLRNALLLDSVVTAEHDYIVKLVDAIIEYDLGGC
jgi:hypothetical protein